MPVTTIKTVGICEHCEKPIFKGDRVWFKGSDLYCHSLCLIASFSVSAKAVHQRVVENEPLREKAIEKQKRIDMMSEIFERRQKARMNN